MAGIKNSGDADCPNLLDIEICNQTDPLSPKPNFGSKCKVFELDPCQNVAKVRLLNYQYNKMDWKVSYSQTLKQTHSIIITKYFTIVKKVLNWKDYKTAMRQQVCTLNPHTKPPFMGVRVKGGGGEASQKMCKYINNKSLG